MHKLIRLEKSRGPRSRRLAASVLAVTAAITAAVGGMAGQANATPAAGADEAQPGLDVVRFQQARLTYGLLTISGTRAGDEIALRLQAGDPATLQVDVGDDGSPDFSFDRAEIAAIAVTARGGDDLVRIDESNGVVTDGIPTAIRGGSGDDTLSGGSGAETFFGGDGKDSIDGNRGADVAFMGAGNDVFVWDPGDGSDVVEGQRGNDTMLFNGAAGPEQVDVSANGNRLRFFRNPGNITMDTESVERVDFNALGGTDLVTVNDLTGTDVNEVNLDLGVGGNGDAQADQVIVNGTDGVDAIDANGDAGGVELSGLAATIGILHPEAADDRLDINTLAGTDAVDSGGLAAGTIQLFVDGVLVP